MTENKEICACPKCSCPVTGSKVVKSEGKKYCCDACADGHQTDASCCTTDCKCA